MKKIISLVLLVLSFGLFGSTCHGGGEGFTREQIEQLRESVAEQQDQNPKWFDWGVIVAAVGKTKNECKWMWRNVLKHQLRRMP
jgi:hypothetical protein